MTAMEAGAQAEAETEAETETAAVAVAAATVPSMCWFMAMTTAMTTV